MKDRPIIFSGEMIRAILDGRKTQTRRVIKTPKEYETRDAGVEFGCPYGQPGDRLWVRENIHRGKEGNLAFYAADNGLVTKNGECVPWVFNEPHVPSIYMPRWASRITLEIMSVRVERIRDISEVDAKAEGVQPCGEHMTLCPDCCYRNEFAHLWNSLNAKRGYGWDVNPWVWVIEFKRIEKEKP